MSSTTETAAQQSATSGELSPSDAQLALSVAEQLNRGDRHGAGQAFIELYNRHYTLLRAFIASRAGRSDADDVAQEVWQRVWQYLPTRFRGGNFRAWVHEIARNYLIDCSRRQKTRPQLTSEFSRETDHSAHAPSTRIEEAEKASALKRCLDQLGQNNADAAKVVRAITAGENYVEICERFSIPKDRAYMLFHQAKKQLTQCVEQSQV
jgi:RNA polymerase sigma-70 factor (ECF subfamily)